MYDNEEKTKQIAVILHEIQKFIGIGIPGDDLLYELEYIQKVLKITLYDWPKVANYMIGLWENYAGNPELPENDKENISLLIHQSVDALRELASNKGYLNNCNVLLEQLISEIKEKNLNLK